MKSDNRFHAFLLESISYPSSFQHIFFCFSFSDLPLHGIFFCTVHLWVWISGTQPKGGTIPVEVAGLGSCKGSLVRVWFPFLKPHVLFFFIQGPHRLHSVRSHWTATEKIRIFFRMNQLHNWLYFKTMAYVKMVWTFCSTGANLR